MVYLYLRNYILTDSLKFLEYHQRIVLVRIFNVISYECSSLLDCHSYVKDKTLVNEDVIISEQKAFNDSVIRNQVESCNCEREEELQLPSHYVCQCPKSSQARHIPTHYICK